MLFQNIFLAFALSAIGFTQDIDNNDVPTECRSVCQSVVDFTTSCDQQNNDDDSGYINCVCNTQNAATDIPACEACVAQFSNDGNDNDVNDLVRSCSFTTTSFNPSATSGSASVTQISGASTNTAQTTSGASMASTTQSQGASQTSGSGTAAAENTGAAAMLAANGVGAGVGLGVLGVAMGML